MAIFRNVYKVKVIKDVPLGVLVEFHGQQFIVDKKDLEYIQ